MSKKAHFNLDWCNKELYPTWYLWLRADEKDTNSFKCLLCKKCSSLSNMGRKAIESHESGEKHKKMVKLVTSSGQLTIKQSFNLQPSTSSSSDSTMHHRTETNAIHVLLPENSTTSPALLDIKEKSVPSIKQGYGRLQSYLLNDQVTRAEILWCLKTVMSHLSYRANVDLPELFREMFPDSEIAKKFQLKKDKTSYVITYGLAPFFYDQLVSDLILCDCLVVCFDESLNKVVQKGQMDIHVRFWDRNLNLVTTRYLTSVFLGHATASVLLDAFKSAIPRSKMRNIIQVSMDGPNVNLKFHSLLQTEQKETTGSQTLVQIGTCGLHVFHGAFKTGHSNIGWELQKFLYALYNLFKDSPARRMDFTRFSGSSDFPFKFCSVRWVESSSAAERALIILPNVRKYVDGCIGEKKEPSTKTYNTVKSMIKDKMLEAKLGFYISVASDIEPFLRKFQSNKPMAPLLYEEIENIIRSLMARFIKASVLESCSLTSQLTRIDMKKESNLKPVRECGIGFAAKTALKKAKCSELQVFSFLKDCQMFLQRMIEKLLERSPLRYKLTKGISCFSPSILPKTLISTKRLDIALEVFVECQQIGAVMADQVKTEFGNFVASGVARDAMIAYNKATDRLDQLYYDLLFGNPEYAKLFMFVQKVLILSHGNATVESGFSINKALLVENLREQSVTALRTVYDAINAAGGISKVKVTKPMIHAARNAHSKYREELEKNRKQLTEANRRLTEKRKAVEAVKELELRKRRIQGQAAKSVSEIEAEIQKLK